jgi:hypothetical protein
MISQWFWFNRESFLRRNWNIFVSQWIWNRTKRTLTLCNMDLSNLTLSLNTEMNLLITGSMTTRLQWIWLAKFLKYWESPITIFSLRSAFTFSTNTCTIDSDWGWCCFCVWTLNILCNFTGGFQACPKRTAGNPPWLRVLTRHSGVSGKIW